MSRKLATSALVGVLSVAATLAITGCNRPPYELAPVQGKVTLDGQPLDGGVVNFQPIASGGTDVGPGSTGRCDSSGSFVLVTIHQETGAIVGEHRVRIYSYSPETPASSDSDAGPSQERVPQQYNYRTTLTFTVPADGTNNAVFELSTK